MKRAVNRIFILAVGFIFISNAGCGQPQAPSEKMSRLIAVENKRLKKELDSRNSQIQKLTRQHDKETKKQEKLLAECIKEKESWKKKAQQNLKNQVDGVFDAVMERNAKLLEENEKLKAEINKLQN